MEIIFKVEMILFPSDLNFMSIQKNFFCHFTHPTGDEDLNHSTLDSFNPTCHGLFWSLQTTVNGSLIEDKNIY